MINVWRRFAIVGVQRWVGLGTVLLHDHQLVWKDFRACKHLLQRHLEVDLPHGRAGIYRSYHARDTAHKVSGSIPHLQAARRQPWRLCCQRDDAPLGASWRGERAPHGDWKLGEHCFEHGSCDVPCWRQFVLDAAGGNCRADQTLVVSAYKNWKETKHAIVL